MFVGMVAEARGYREVRYPLMEKAAELASQHLQKIRKLSPMKEDAPVYPGRKK
jgi:hypothetical protein